MATLTKLNTFSVSNNNLKNEINNKLPFELEEKNKEFNKLKIQIKTLIDLYNEKLNEYNDINKTLKQFEIDIEEKRLIIDNLKTQQKIIFKQITSKFFESFIEILEKVKKEIYKVFLVFIDYNEENEIQLKFLLNNKDNLSTLLFNSFEYFKLIYETSKNEYDNKKNIIITSINNFINSIEAPFDIIFHFMKNTFTIIELINENKENELQLLKLNNTKNKIFIEKTIIESQIQKNENNLGNLEKYINNIDSILKKYKNIFSPKTENKKEVMENVLLSFKNLKKNDFYKKNSFNKSSRNKDEINIFPSKNIKTKPISIISIQNFNKKTQKPNTLSVKNSCSYSKINKSINYSKNNNSNNGIQINGIISTDISDSGDKIKKSKINIAKLKSRSNSHCYDKSKNKTLINNNTIIQKKNKLVKKNKINLHYGKNKFMKFEKVNKAESDNDDSGLKTIYDNETIMDEKYDISNELQIQNLKNDDSENENENKRIKGCKSLQNLTQKINKINDFEKSERINFKPEKIQNNDNCWASCT